MAKGGTTVRIRVKAGKAYLRKLAEWAEPLYRDGLIGIRNGRILGPPELLAQMPRPEVEILGGEE